ncbi:thiamine diphosphokinase [Aerococcus agrisoli]|uniref:Thiamine diphosphokinase n=1 Tax=Aerococcus agrisoli TaxID=2487350 RepID=A0A3N4GQ20_9LACT|nr:thiamine diphosphokinase [Aerococcus agrisoli]RPA60710.1 thiamine diphosphokinase [Aerococcus agrisoli]
MQVYLIGSGPFDPAFFKEYVAQQAAETGDRDRAFIGVDLGAKRFLDLGLTIDLAVGDFDSVDAETYQRIVAVSKEVEKLEPMKDETDTEHALGSVAQRYPGGTYHLFGMLGGRVDHLLSNIWLIFQEKFQAIMGQIHLIEEDNRISFLLAGKHSIDRIPGMKYLSFVAMTAVKDLTLANVVYTLQEYQMPTPLALISNEFLPDVDTMEISFTEGFILAIQARDGQK